MRKGLQFIYLFLLAASLAACQRELSAPEKESPFISFRISGDIRLDVDETKGTLVNSNISASDFSFGVSEYTNSGADAVSSFQNINPDYLSSTTCYHSGKTWEAGAYVSTAYQFFAYAPYLSGGSGNGLTLSGNKKSISYNVSSVSVADQPDLMTAYYSTTYLDPVPLSFTHRLCAVKIVLAPSLAGSTLNSLKFGNIIYRGDFSLQNGALSNTSSGAYTINDSNGIEDLLNSNGYLMMIPQDVNTSVTLRYTQGGAPKSIAARLIGTWSAGQVITYTFAATGEVVMTVEYPEAWGTAPGPVTEYASAESFGLFAVNPSTNKIEKSNVEVTASAAGAKVGLTLPVDTYPDTYRYFLYYPYESDLTTTYTTLALNETNSSVTADAFFSSVIGGWSPAADQSADWASLKAQDLQVGMLSGNRFVMEHKMGLAVIDLAANAQTVPTTRYFVDANYYWDSMSGTSANTTTINASGTFSSSAKAYVSGTKGYYVLGTSASTTLTTSSTISTTNGTFDGAYSSGDANAGNNWTWSGTGSANTITAIAPSFSTVNYYGWSKHVIAAGEVLYSDGAISACTSETISSSEFSGRTAIGIIFATAGQLSSNDTDRGWTHGVALALSGCGDDYKYCATRTDAPVPAQSNCVTVLETRYREGYNDTNLLQAASNPSYPAARAAWNYQARAKNGSSSVALTGMLVARASYTAPHWYLPSCGQIIDIAVNIAGFGTAAGDMSYRNSTTLRWQSGSSTTFISTINSIFQQVINAGYSSVVKLDTSTTHPKPHFNGLWSSTEFDDDCAYGFQLWDDGYAWFDNAKNSDDDYKTAETKVYPVISF